MMIHMKTTLEIDEDLVRRVMELAEIRTKTEAIEFALNAAERLLRRQKLLDETLPDEMLEACVDPGYDPVALRESDVPH